MKNVVLILDRVMLMQLETRPITYNIIQMYDSTCNASEEKVEVFYKDIKKAMDNTKTSDINIVMGDFNAKVGRGRRDNIVDKYGLGTLNERGARMVQFCQEEDLIITNTHFKQHLKRLYTWTSNVDKNIRNQIDYIILYNINKRF